MKKYIISILMCIVPVLGTSAQNFIDSLIQVYDHASIEEKRIMDIAMTKSENAWKKTGSPVKPCVYPKIIDSL